MLRARQSDSLFRLLLNPGPAFRARISIALASAFLGPAITGDGRLYLNLGHTGLNQPDFAGWLQAADVRPIYFVHDLIPITHPQYCRAGEYDRHRQRMETILGTAVGIIGNSQATLDELKQFADTVGRPMPPSLPDWLGSDLNPVQLPAGKADSPSAFVILGTIEARKNHLLLLQLWKDLAKRLHGDTPRLIIVGQRGWECEDVFDRLDNDAALRAHVVERNDCSDAEIAEILASARALLFPSFVEGFGLPLVEALASGTPVIASDLPVFREIGQGVPDLVPVNDLDAWDRAIRSYARPDSESRAAQMERLRQFRLFGWDDHFAAVGPWLAKL